VNNTPEGNGVNNTINQALKDIETDVLTFNSKNADVKFSALKSALARVGHDTDTFKADKKVYRSLRECCHYRKN
jgi:Cu(I)/Ag(I) efflux system membrane fusion protein